jgi:phage shock protein C
MYCNTCGKGIAEDARFCTYCGTVVGTVPQPKKLMRSRSDRKIAGVCAGLAQYLGWDIALVRILTVFITLLAGVFPGVIAYILAWIIVSEEPEVRPVAAGQPVAS